MSKPQLVLKIPTTSIVSESNVSDHWTKKRKRRILQDKIVKICWLSKKPKIKLPCIIKLTKIGRKMDYSNMVASLKHIQDSVADLILPGLPPGRADGDSRLEWKYEQNKGTDKFRKGVIIEIYQKDKPDE